MHGTGKFPMKLHISNLLKLLVIFIILTQIKRKIQQVNNKLENNEMVIVLQIL